MNEFLEGFKLGCKFVCVQIEPFIETKEGKIVNILEGVTFKVSTRVTREGLMLVEAERTFFFGSGTWILLAIMMSR